MAPKTLLLLGGGHANLQVLVDAGVAALRKSGAVRCVLLSESRTATYSGMLPAVVSGLVPTNAADTDLSLLCRAYGFSLVLGRATRIDTAARCVTFDAHGVARSLAYSVLSVNVGSVTRGVRGTEEGDENVVMTRPIGALASKLDKWQQKKGAGSRSRSRIVVVGGGAAGVELTFAVHARLRGAVTLVSRSRALLSGNGAANEVTRELQRRGIACVLGRCVERIDTSTRTVHLQHGTRLPYDLCVVATGAAPVALEHDLPTSDDGWIRVDNTLRCGGVFAAGDCAHVPGTPVKAGVFAVRQGAVLAHNVAAALRYGDNTDEDMDKVMMKTYVPQTHYLSLVSTADGRAVGTKYGVMFAGHWVFRLKMFLDEGWQRRFRVAANRQGDRKEEEEESEDGNSLFQGDPVQAAAVLTVSDDMGVGDGFATQLAILRRMEADEAFRAGVQQAVRQRC